MSYQGGGGYAGGGYSRNGDGGNGNGVTQGGYQDGMYDGPQIGGYDGGAGYDDGYDQQGGGPRPSASFAIPDIVRDFIVFFHKQVMTKNTYEIGSIYENSWPKLTERFYKEEPWPSSADIADLVGGDQTFLILYNELYYRHIYEKLTPSIEQRRDSYENYCDLFNLIVHNGESPEEPVDLELPNKWIWDIIDEFIYQFESFSQYRAKLANKTDAEMTELETNPRLWNVHIVLNVLHSLIDKSNINEQLEAFKNGDNPNDVAGSFGQKTLYKMLGYFSLVGLLRLHCLLGDYYQALRVMENIELNKKGLYSRVPACQVSVFYYVGFCYMMMGRYQDAVRTFSNILFYILRTQGQGRTHGGYSMINKKKQQLFHLLAIVMTLCPQRIDESVHAQLLGDCGEKMVRMGKGDDAAFEELFSNGCPKFISSTAPDFESATNRNMEPYRLQLKIFLNEIRQSLQLPLIRSYLKLYSTMPIEKLAQFCEIDGEAQDAETFRIALHQYKHKTNQMAWSNGTALEGERVPTADVDFYIDSDMIHIADVKIERNFGEYFMHSIYKMCQEAQ